MSRWAILAGVAATAAFAMFGCGQDRSGDNPKSTAKTVAGPPDQLELEQAESAPPTTAELVANVEAAWRAFNTGDIASFGMLFADDATWEAKGMGGEVQGRPAVITAVAAYKTAFPNLVGERQLLVAHGRLVASIDVVVGTHTGDFMGTPPTQNRVGMPVFQLYEFDDRGKIARQVVYYDHSGLLAQLGVMAVPHRAAIEHTGTPGPIVIATDSKAEAAIMAAMALAEEAMINGDTATAMSFVASDVVVHDYSMPRDVTGKANIATLSQMWATAIPDAAFASDGYWVAGDYVVRFGNVAGTHTGPMPMLGVAKGTGNPVAYQFAEIARFSGGSVVETWGFGNNLQLFLQLGVLNPPAE